MDDEYVIDDISLQTMKREELDKLKQQRLERLKTSTTANFSGKQKKSQLRARKHRLEQRKQLAAAIDTASNNIYKEFYEDKPDLANNNEGNLIVMNDETSLVSSSTSFTDQLARDLTKSRLKLTVALGRHKTDDTTSKELSSYFVKETKEQIQLRLMEGQKRLDISKRLSPLRAKAILRDPILDHPKRPKWKYTMSKEKVNENEHMEFDSWLTQIHEKYDNEDLNHFEHNLEVWRELWRVMERATHIVLVTDIRNPLLHIPPSIYEYVTVELKKPLVIVLNKVDLIPPSVVSEWKGYLTSEFPMAKFVLFSSRSLAVAGDNDIGARRRILSKKLVLGDTSAMNGAVAILDACEIDQIVAKALVDEINGSFQDESTLNDNTGTVDTFNIESNKHAKTKSRRKKNKFKYPATTQSPLYINSQPGKGKSIQLPSCNHCGADDASIVCLTCKTGVSNAVERVENQYIDLSEAIAKQGYLLCNRCDSEEHDNTGANHDRQKISFKERSANYHDQQLNAITTGNHKYDAENDRPTTVIGLIGHPNVGKSSVLNALAGRKLVSVSHTPGHTKRLQSIRISHTIEICDCPGLVFPLAQIPKYLQELCGLYPYSQVREPYSSVRFLAEHISLEKILALKPRTQEFDGILEDLDWTPWTICEAYAEKRGYRTDRRGRPDHQRAGTELIRDCVDGILPLHFLPPNNLPSGRKINPVQSMNIKDDKKSFETQDSSNEVERTNTIVTNSPQLVKARSPTTIAGKINAFSLLDDDDDSDNDTVSD